MAGAKLLCMADWVCMRVKSLHDYGVLSHYAGPSGTLPKLMAFFSVDSTIRSRLMLPCRFLRDIVHSQLHSRLEIINLLSALVAMVD